jgi:hypothetical protein
MCGPTGTEKSLQQSSQNFASVLQSAYGTLFGNQQSVLSAIKGILSPILSKGPSQQGMSAEERNARQTAIINAGGAAARNAQQAARTFGAGQGGGGTSGVTSGITKQIQAAIGSQAAQSEGAQQANLVAQDYDIGRQNFWQAQGGMQSLGQQYNPNATAGAAINENESSYKQASDIASQAPGQQIAGVITSLGGEAASAFGAYEGAHKG